MFNPKNAIIPGLIASIFVLSLLSKVALFPVIKVEAATQAPVTQSPPGEKQKENRTAASSSDECALPTGVMDSVKQWCGLIEQAADKYGLDPMLLAAVITQESGGQAEVISASGAVGLMQVMPSDGIAASFQCANGPCFAKRPSTTQLLDPQFNLDYGARMLASLIERHSDVREALAAYGPYNVGYYYADKVLAILAGY